MPNLIIDTVTTGYWKYDEGITSPNQPKMVGLSAILEEEDHTIIDQMSRIIQLPKGYSVTEGAEKFHGIRTIDVKEYGEPLEDIIAQFKDMLLQATLEVAFNSTHHEAVIRRSFIDAKIDYPAPEPPTYCAMRMATQVTRIVDRRGNYKWPSLAEAYYHFAKQPLSIDFTQGPRDVMSQRVAAVRRVYHGLQHHFAVISRNASDEVA